MKKFKVTQQQYMQIFFKYGMVCFSLVTIANIYDLVRKWNMIGFEVINKVSSIATIIFFMMLVGMFWFQLKGIKNVDQLDDIPDDVKKALEGK